jgi:hypothetical protein
VQVLVVRMQRALQSTLWIVARWEENFLPLLIYPRQTYYNSQLVGYEPEGRDTPHSSCHAGKEQQYLRQ